MASTIDEPSVASDVAPSGLRRVRVWDLPTRIFHWTLAAAVIGSFVTAKVGGNAMAWHFRLGYLVCALLVFRLIWGFVGGRWSRFASFVRGPATVLRYLRGQLRPGEALDVGHNPLGAFSVLAMLGLVALQVASGSVADDEIANTGPLNRYVSSAVATTATSWHKTVGQYGLVALVALHLGAVTWYLRRRKVDLVRPMLHGDKLLPAEVEAARDDGATRVLALVLAAACIAAVLLVLRLSG
jgi:cytochrome b